MNYIFKTKTTMKDYNCEKWFIDKGDYSGWSTQYINLWVTILSVVDTYFN